ncbi:MAG: CDGSH iron-sulfur domain-containing protein [Bacteroidales bacterium]|nr:CDGSH iron-sulfur domain-containing protein [Bacteroidales bacterium]
MENERSLFKVMDGGPLKVTGPKRMKGSDGKIIKTDKPVFLCRCGNSSNKPFCDGTHKRNGFSK